MHSLLTVGEVATALRTSRATVRAMLEAGKFPGAFRLGVGTKHTNWRIPRNAHHALRHVEG